MIGKKILAIFCSLVLVVLVFRGERPNAALAQRPFADKSDLLYSTFLGGESADGANVIALDGEGNAYIAGSTCSDDFLSEAVSLQTTGPCTAFIVKFDPSNSLVYATKLGGDGGFDSPTALALDLAGNVYVTGSTSSADFPTTPNAFDRTLDGWNDAFVLKLDSSGNLVYSTFLGGSSSNNNADGFDWASGIAVNDSGQVFVTGMTRSVDFPTTENAFDRTLRPSDGGDAFLARVNETGSELLYSTFLGRAGFDTGTDVALDTNGDVVVTGYTQSLHFPTTPGAFQTRFHQRKCGGDYCPEIFVTKFSTSTGALVYSTLLGGGKRDESRALFVDGTGAVYLTGLTDSRNFPVTPGAFDTTFNGKGLFRWDAFALKLAADGSALEYSTFLGGTNYEEGRDITVDARGAAYVVGSTTSDNFPTTHGAYDRKCNSGCQYLLDAFFVKLNRRGSNLRYGTFIGGGNTGTTAAWADPGHESASGIAVDSDGIAHIVGSTKSTDFPTTPDALDKTLGSYVDGFLLKIKPTFHK